MKKLLSILLATVFLTLIPSVCAAVADGYRVIGDVDEDGEVTILDATCIQRSLALLRTFSPLQSYLGDVDGVGGVTILDATIIQRSLADISYDFYKYRLYSWRAKIDSVSMPPSVSPVTVGTSMAFHIDEAAHEIPSEYEVYLGENLLRERSTNAHFSYTFNDAGNYTFTVIAYDPFGGSDVFRFEMTVKSREDLIPKITSAVYNRNTKILSVVAVGGTAPYQYQYIIRNNVSAFPPGQFATATDFDFSYDENGVPILKCAFCQNSAVMIPTELLTKTLTYTCEIKVRDALGNLSNVSNVAIRF